MHSVRRGLAAVAGIATLGLIWGSAAAAHADPATPDHPTEHVCTTNPAPGQETCFAVRQTDTMTPYLAPNALPSGYGPSDLQQAYNLTSAAASNGGNATVAIVDAYDDPNAESDLASYRSTYGLPSCTTANGCFSKVDQRGGTNYPSANTGWAGEISLDVDMVSAICPNCDILLVEADSASLADLGAAVNEAVDLGAKYVSNSYGGGDSSGDSQADEQYYNHPGVAVTASTGDNGFGISYPAASPYVTAVGGTSLQQSGSETAWSGSGSGCSDYESQPAYQQGVSTSCDGRANADVSALADPQTGVAVYQTYGGNGWAVYGGTSASSPIIAGVYALAGTPGTGDTPAAYPYSHTGALNDVTRGSNGSCTRSVLCNAGPGWDGPTGLGTPNGTAAFTAGATTPPSGVTVSNPGDQSGTVDSAVSLQLSAGGGTAPYTWTATGLPTGLSISDSGLVSGTPGETGTFTVTATAEDSTGATGSASFGWTVTTGGGGGGCTGVPAWDGGTLYTPGDVVSYGGHTWTSQWYSVGDTPGAPTSWYVWQDNGPC